MEKGVCEPPAFTCHFFRANRTLLEGEQVFRQEVRLTRGPGGRRVSDKCLLPKRETLPGLGSTPLAWVAPDSPAGRY